MTEPSGPTPPLAAVPPPGRPRNPTRHVVGAILGLVAALGLYALFGFGIGALIDAMSNDTYLPLTAIGWGAMAQALAAVPLAVATWRRGWRGFPIALAIGSALLFLGSSLCMGAAYLQGGF